MALSARARSRTWPTVAVTLALLLLVPVMGLDDRTLGNLTLALVFAVAAVGLDVFSGYAGQISIGNFGLVAVGSYTSAVLTNHAGMGVWLTLPLCLLTGGLVALLLGYPMIRLGELGAAFLTFFFGFLVVVVLAMPKLAPVTNSVNGLAPQYLTLGGQDLSSGTGLYLASWVALAVAALVACRYADSRAGRSLRVVKRSPVVAAALGIDVTAARLSAFVFSGMLAGVAGFLYAQSLGFIAPENFSSSQSLTLLIMVIVGGMGSIAGPIIGAVALTLLTQATRDAGSSREIYFAVVLIVFLVLLPDGLYGAAERLWRRIPRSRRRGSTHPAAEPVPPVDSASAARELVALEQASPAEPGARGGDELLVLTDVVVSFGGLRALRGASLTVREGEIHALMGPNGAGKTTILNCISGLQRYDGDIRFAGRPLGRLSPQQVRRGGISRTFQNPSLVADLTVRENVGLGLYGDDPRSVVGDLLPTPRTRRRDRHARDAAVAALELVGVRPELWDRPASDLSLADQKLTDLARAVVAVPRLVLLDEPTAGLHDTEIDNVRTALRNINESTGLTILVIAHHIGFLRELAHAATVLDFGRQICTGAPDAVLARQDVLDVFVGGAHV
jgi:branched-chain amino acid transport system permease protein